MKNRFCIEFLGLCLLLVTCMLVVPAVVYGSRSSTPPASVPVNMLIDYGNGASVWFNGTIVPSSWNFYNVTVLDTRGNVASIFFASFGSHFIYQLNGVGCQSSNPFCDSSWGLWILQGSCWTLASSGVDQILVSHNAAIGWFLVPAATLGNTTPNGVNCVSANIDVKPTADPAIINSGSNGKIPVLILSTSTFNATSQVEVSSLTFGETGTEHSLSACNNFAQGNVTGLLCLFNTQAARFNPGDTLGILNGIMTDGTPFVGTDVVTVR